MTGTLLEGNIYFLITSRLLLRMTNVSDKSCRENQNRLYVQNMSFENRDVDEIIRGKKYFRAWQATDDNMAHANCMPGT